MAATVHLVGITFYGLFASGELQPWAEPSLEEQASWDNGPKPVTKDDGMKETNLVRKSLKNEVTLCLSHGPGHGWPMENKPKNVAPTAPQAFTQCVKVKS